MCTSTQVACGRHVCGLFGAQVLGAFFGGGGGGRNDKVMLDEREGGDKKFWATILKQK